MKDYSAPAITEYGSVADLTGIFGSATTSDVLVDPNGRVVQTGPGSMDACPTVNFDTCHMH